MSYMSRITLFTDEEDGDGMHVFFDVHHPSKALDRARNTAEIVIQLRGDLRSKTIAEIEAMARADLEGILRAAAGE